MHVHYSYLAQQFAEVDEIFADLRGLVASGEFTLGPYVEAFERKFAQYLGVKHAIGTNTGTDALILALKGAGVRPGDEVITVPNTFVATVGAIVAAGARPVFVDCDARYQMNVDLIPARITTRTKAILPVHWGGAPADIEGVLCVARQHDLAVVEDACPATGAQVRGRFVGGFGKAAAFSMHPLKPLNVWGDGGVVVTNDDKVAKYLRLYRNHGLTDRDHVELWGENKRLQPVQAVVASRMLDRIEPAIAVRIRNARRLDEGLHRLKPFIRSPARLDLYREVYQLYIVSAQRRDELLQYLHSRAIEARVHYPIPLHLQRAAANLGYRPGAFPVCEAQTKEIITLPAHQFITDEQIDYMIDSIGRFYGWGCRTVIEQTLCVSDWVIYHALLGFYFAHTLAHCA